MISIQDEIQKLYNCKHSPLYSELQLQDEIIYLQELEESLGRYTPKIAIIGEFSSGKSTLINAFLGKDILPAKFSPTTQFITHIKYSNNEKIVVDGKEFLATKDTLFNLSNIQSNKIDLYLDIPILQKTTFIDTPGTNDPSTFTDDIVFELVGNVDIVLFVFNSMSALRETEQQFLSKLIRKKDIGKFFFILNWADKIEEPLILKNDFVDLLSSLLDLDRSQILNHTLILSAKNALDNYMSYRNDKRFQRLKDTLNDFIAKNKLVFRQEIIDNAIDNVKGSILVKIETLEESINGKADSYKTEQEQIEENIKSFELAISKELIVFEREFNNIIFQYKNSIIESFKYVKVEIAKEISQLDYKELTSSRYIELRTKKLLEDRIEEDTKIFIEQMEQIVIDFDKTIKANNAVKNLHISSLNNTKKAQKVVNITAVGALVSAGTTVAPVASSMLVGSSIATGLGSLTPLLAGIPVVGTVLAGATSLTMVAVPAIGVVALTAGKILFDVGKWGVGIIGKGVDILEEKAAKAMYKQKVIKSISEIENQLLKEIDVLNVKEFQEKYIEHLFPEKILLEKKIQLLQEKQSKLELSIQEQILELEEIKINLGVVS